MPVHVACSCDMWTTNRHTKEIAGDMVREGHLLCYLTSRRERKVPLPHNELNPQHIQEKTGMRFLSKYFLCANVLADMYPIFSDLKLLSLFPPIL